MLPEWVPHARGAPWSLRGPRPCSALRPPSIPPGPPPGARPGPTPSSAARERGGRLGRGEQRGEGVRGSAGRSRVPGPGPGAALRRVCGPTRTFLASACFGFSLHALLQAPTASSSCQRHVRPRTQAQGLGRGDPLGWGGAGREPAPTLRGLVHPSALVGPKTIGRSVPHLRG